MDTETMYAIRRKDGEPLYGEWSFAIVSGPDDWDAADADAEDSTFAVTYELVEMTVKTVRTRTLPVCAERCDKPAEFWGLCEEHAREDDEETLNEGLAARARQADIGANLPTGFVDTLGDT